MANRVSLNAADWREQMRMANQRPDNTDLLIADALLIDQEGRSGVPWQR